MLLLVSDMNSNAHDRKIGPLRGWWAEQQRGDCTQGPEESEGACTVIRGSNTRDGDRDRRW
jgi:hypothetical protein